REDNSYLPATLTSQDYPSLIPEGERVDTVAVGAVLAVYNSPANTDRHRRVSKFITALFDKFDEFQKPARHPKWKEVNLAAALKGWNRFPPAKEALERAPSQTSNIVDPVLAKQQAARAATGNPKEQERLFQQFMEWNKSQRQRR